MNEIRMQIDVHGLHRNDVGKWSGDVPYGFKQANKNIFCFDDGTQPSSAGCFGLERSVIFRDFKDR